MSRITELIKEKCPNGVKYKKLGDISNITTGKLNANEMVENGMYPFFTCNSEPYRINTYAFDTEAILISGNGSQVGHINYYQGKFNAYQRTYVLDKFKDVNIKYMFHWFKCYLKKYIKMFKKDGSVPYITLPMLQDFKIAIPPLEVQEEIVRILDKFGELEAELEAELEVRKHQYEFWRDKIFKFEGRNDVKWLSLGEIAIDIYRGNGIKRDEIIEGGISCVRYGEIYTTYNIWFDYCISHTSKNVVRNPKIFEHNDLLFAITGESVEEISKTIAYVGDERCYAGGDIVVMKHNQNAKYLSYALSTKDAIFQKCKGKVKSKVVHSNVPSIKEIIVPIVSLKEQEEIVNKLDHFYNIVNSFKYGLPAEIELRRKQYEYYRNKLLSFEELSIDG